MRRKLMGIGLAGLLLVGGATAVLAQSGAAGAVGDAVTSAAGHAGGLLEDVLADLVGDGTLTQEQADAVVDAMQARREEIRSERRALREQFRAFLEDGTLSADELAQLPEDHPLRNLDRYLEDGQLTEDELRELRPLGKGGHHRRGGFGPFGPFGPHGGDGEGHEHGLPPEPTEEPASTS